MASESIQENKKYRDLINTAQQLFFKHGTKRVTIEEVCEKADVSKMTFYKFFRNKNELAAAVLNEFYDKILKEEDEIMKQKIPFIDKIKGIINHSLKLSQEVEDIFLDEVWGPNEELSSLVNSLKMDALKLVTDFIRQGQAEGVIRKSLKPEMLLMLIDIFQNLLNSEQMKMIAPDPHERFDMILNFTFYGIIESQQQTDAGRDGMTASRSDAENK